MNIKTKFEQPISYWTETTLVCADDKPIELPTVEIWRKGDWLARRFSGVQFDLIEIALKKRGIYAERIRV